MSIHTYDSIITLENILVVWQRFLRGKKKKVDVAAFQAELGSNLLSLHAGLRDRTYVHDSYTAFVVTDPKQRLIHKATVRDRVVHHLIHHALYWHFHPRFIFDSYACQRYKGVHRALNRFRQFERMVSNNHTRTCYVLKCDIRKFFASIDQSILLAILKRHIYDEGMMWLLEQVIKSFNSGVPGKGLPLGNLTSQLLVNVYMHEFDVFVKQELRVKYYIRYADDFVVLSQDREYLEYVLTQMRQFLFEKLALTLHPHKVSIASSLSGIDFLGWVHFPHYRALRTVTRRRLEKTFKAYMTRETANSYRALLQHGNTYKMKKKITVL
jgi:RNA-directed DNA polymerase